MKSKLLSSAILFGSLLAFGQEPLLTRPYIEGLEPEAVDSVPALRELTRDQIAELLPYQYPAGNIRLFSGYRHLERVSFARRIEWMVPDVSGSVVDVDMESVLGPDFEETLEDETVFQPEKPVFDVMNPNYTPLWLSRSQRAARMAADLEYSYILNHPLEQTYLAWELPEPPSLLPDDYSFAGFIKRLDIPDVARQETLGITPDFKKTHWLHTTTDGIQFSQAYV